MTTRVFPLPHTFHIRPAAESDTDALLAVYSYYVAHTNVTFEYEVPAPEVFRNRIRHTLQKYPYLVAVENGRILGYAYASAFKDRRAYDWSVETSIYVAHDCCRGGVGTALYRQLEELLLQQHIYNLCACIAWPNPESVAFHEKFGYRTVAHFTNSGYKAGEWLDMIWMEKHLAPHSVPPLPLIPFPKIKEYDDGQTDPVPQTSDPDGVHSAD